MAMVSGYSIHVSARIYILYKERGGGGSRLCFTLCYLYLSVYQTFMYLVLSSYDNDKNR